jgi:hypothetical protein
MTVYVDAKLQRLPQYSFGAVRILNNLTLVAERHGRSRLRRVGGPRRKPLRPELPGACNLIHDSLTMRLDTR